LDQFGVISEVEIDGKTNSFLNPLFQEIGTGFSLIWDAILDTFFVEF